MLSVHWILGLNWSESNTQAQPTVIIHSGSPNVNEATFPQLFILNSVHWILGLNCLEKNIQAQLTVIIH